mgnify:FL=1
MMNHDINRADVAASFQQSVVDILVERAMRGCKELGLNKLALAGGVSANKHLRAAMEQACKEHNIEFNVPKPILCTDNAAMIGSAGYYEFMKGNTATMDINAYPSLKLGESAFHKN